MAVQCGTLRFVLDDNRERTYNESVDLEYRLFLENEDDEILELNDFVDYCRQFALAMGYLEKSVDEAFGRL